MQGVRALNVWVQADIPEIGRLVALAFRGFDTDQVAEQAVGPLIEALKILATDLGRTNPQAMRNTWRLAERMRACSDRRRSRRGELPKHGPTPKRTRKPRR